MNRTEHTNELLISDVQGHVAERRGHGAHHAVVVYPEQLHEDGQAFLLPDGGSDVHWPLRKRREAKALDAQEENPVGK